MRSSTRDRSAGAAVCVVDAETGDYRDSTVRDLYNSARLVDAMFLLSRAEAHGVPLYTDARHYSAAGIPTVLYGAGPRTLEEANGHMADENLLLDDLHKATEVIALTLRDFLK